MEFLILYLMNVLMKARVAIRKKDLKMCLGMMSIVRLVGNKSRQSRLITNKRDPALAR